MMRSKRWFVLALIAAIPLAACTGSASVSEHVEDPARVEQVAGAQFGRVVLSAKAADRLGIQTAPVSSQAAQLKTVPYAAVLYDAHGDTWTYANPQPLTFVREHIKVDRVDGDVAVLSEGPPSGSPVVTVGAVELLGVESGVGEG